jgi:hypothetical protein
MSPEVKTRTKPTFVSNRWRVLRRIKNGTANTAGGIILWEIKKKIMSGFL